MSVESAPNPWFSWTYLERNIDDLLRAGREHLFITIAAMLLAIAVAIPLTLLVRRYPRLQVPVLRRLGDPLHDPLARAHRRTVAVARPDPLDRHRRPGDVRPPRRAAQHGRRPRGRLVRRSSTPRAAWATADGSCCGRCRCPSRRRRSSRVSASPRCRRWASSTIGALVGHGGFGTVILGGFVNNFYHAQILAGTIAVVVMALLLEGLLVLLERLLTPWTRVKGSW